MGVSSNAFFHRTVCTLYLAMWVGQRGRGMCLFVFDAPPVPLEAACLMMAMDQCLHAPHGLTSTKQSQPSWERNLSPFSVCPIRMGARRECLHLIFQSCTAAIHILNMDTGSQCSLGELWPISVLLNCVLICCFGVGFFLCRQDALSHCSSHFVTVRHCQGINSQ